MVRRIRTIKPRKGLGKGKGKGYKNIIRGYDAKVHKDSAKGRKQPQRLKAGAFVKSRFTDAKGKRKWQVILQQKEVYYKSPGLKVSIRFKQSSPFGRRHSTYHNVTEIHRKFPSTLEPKIAFESDTHRTGITQPLKYIESIYIEPEKRVYKEF